MSRRNRTADDTIHNGASVPRNHESTTLKCIEFPGSGTPVEDGSGSRRRWQWSRTESLLRNSQIPIPYPLPAVVNHGSRSKLYETRPSFPEIFESTPERQSPREWWRTSRERRQGIGRLMLSRPDVGSRGLSTTPGMMSPDGARTPSSRCRRFEFPEAVKYRTWPIAIGEPHWTPGPISKMRDNAKQSLDGALRHRGRVSRRYRPSIEQSRKRDPAKPWNACRRW